MTHYQAETKIECTYNITYEHNIKILATHKHKLIKKQKEKKKAQYIYPAKIMQR